MLCKKHYYILTYEGVFVKKYYCVHCGAIHVDPHGDDKLVDGEIIHYDIMSWLDELFEFEEESGD